MGNGMNKVLPGLYLGNFRDAKDTVQLAENKITHILSIHDNSRPILMDKVYLCLPVSDSPTQNISQFFSQCNDFIHNARVNGGNVLVHCLAGVSRSVTVVVAYVMTVTELGWRDSLNAVRGARNCASPNFGFQRQLLEFQHENLMQERERLDAKFPRSPFPDLEECRKLIEINSKWVTTGEFPSDEREGLKTEENGAESESREQNSKVSSQTESKRGNVLPNDVSTLAAGHRSSTKDSKADALSDSRSFSLDGIRGTLDELSGKIPVKSKDGGAKM